MTKKLLTTAIMIAALLMASAASAAMLTKDFEELKFAKIVLTYADKCVVSGLSKSTLAKAQQVWDAGPQAERDEIERDFAAMIRENPNEDSMCLALAAIVRSALSGNPSPIDDTKQKRAITGLSAKISRYERSGDYTYVMVAVDNQSGQSCASTRWSCIFYRDEEPVHEDGFRVPEVRPNAQTVKRSITRFGGTFNRSECKLLDVG